MLVSGMIIGSMFTLFVVPSIYMFVARQRAAVPVADGGNEVAVGTLAEAPL